MVSAARKRDFRGQLAIIRAVSDPADGSRSKLTHLPELGPFVAMRSEMPRQFCSMH